MVLFVLLEDDRNVPSPMVTNKSKKRTSKFNGDEVRTFPPPFNTSMNVAIGPLISSCGSGISSPVKDETEFGRESVLTMDDDGVDEVRCNSFKFENDLS